ncbi:hypothetical protein B0H17DRAFT_1149308 [Mycena rosella]|uniref:Uncharacterized protein n=1 Tax=Mycena rosella TaxID=1033263 RepID=A0AAD7C363_MYCRO|nr:hypothetical protein B0H17DRAFT_1149308 [Mycena rosella]
MRGPESQHTTNPPSPVFGHPNSAVCTRREKTPVGIAQRIQVSAQAPLAGRQIKRLAEPDDGGALHMYFGTTSTLVPRIRQPQRPEIGPRDGLVWQKPARPNARKLEKRRLAFLALPYSANQPARRDPEAEVPGLSINLLLSGNELERGARPAGAGKRRSSSFRLRLMRNPLFVFWTTSEADFKQNVRRALGTEKWIRTEIHTARKVCLFRKTVIN